MYIKRKNPNNAGRKGHYTDEMPKRVFNLCLLGLTDKQIADAIGIKPNVYYYWKQHRPQFAKAIYEGRLEADAKVAKALYQKAIGYSHRDTVILTNRVTEYDEKGKAVRSYNEPLIVPIVKHYPPDAYAANKWLSIRQREYWADVTKSEHTHTFNAKIDITHIMETISDTNNYTDQELELAAKLGFTHYKKMQSSNN